MFPRLFRTSRTVGFRRKLSGEVETKLEDLQKQTSITRRFAIISGIAVIVMQYNEKTFRSEIDKLNERMQKLEKERYKPQR